MTPLRAEARAAMAAAWLPATPAPMTTTRAGRTPGTPLSRTPAPPAGD